jgi:hypothetical protein
MVRLFIYWVFSIIHCLGTWVPGGHFFLERETISLISKGLSALRAFGRELDLVWRPMYFVIDQSSAEEGGILEAFPGIREGITTVV